MSRLTLIYCAFLIFSGLNGYSQTNFIPDENYFRLTSKALALGFENKHKESAITYDSAFIFSGGKARATDRYDAAFAWANCGNEEKAFDNLYKAIFDCKYSNVEQIVREGKLLKLSADRKLEDLINQVKINKAEKDQKLDKALVMELSGILNKDQEGRIKIDSITKHFGIDSREMKDLWKTIRYNDSTNLIKIRNLLDTKGWLSHENIGDEGSQAIFLVIQHADSATQEKYLPILREAVKKGYAASSQLALLEDRTRMNRGEKQLYGTQLVSDDKNSYKFYPIEDEINVNKRRVSLGLQAIEDYAKHFGIEYKPPL